MNNSGILIYGELTQNYEIRPVVKQLITKSRLLKEKINNEKIKVCVIGDRRNYDKIVEELAGYGADEVIIVNDNRLKYYDKNYHPKIFYEIAKKHAPRIILTGATLQGKEIAANTAVRLNTGLTADCTELNIKDNLLLSTRPTFGGQLIADILCKTFPQMATVQENIFSASQIENSAKVLFDWVDIDKFERKIEILEKVKKTDEPEDVTKAKIVIAGGLGACKDNGFELIKRLAKKLNAAIAGSREAYEHGFIQKSQQIGQTGKTIAPKLYIAVGISGANQHIAGIKNCEKIIAINSDENAPIFKYSDYGIIGNLFEILKELTDKEEKE